MSKRWPSAGPASGFLRSEIATYRRVFPRVLLFKVRPERADAEVQNLIIVALKTGNPALLESADAETAALLGKLYRGETDFPAAILTDDLAPVEYYNSFAQRARQN
jgi:hypothetical protein